VNGPHLAADRTGARNTPDSQASDDLYADTIRIGRGVPGWMDWILAAVALVAAAPAMAVISILIKLDSPGPVIFRQWRLGRERRNGGGPAVGGERRKRSDLPGRPFVFYKFRTMRHDARELYPNFYAFEVSEEGLSSFYLQMPSDPRVTRLGRFLRRTSLDELPNLVNVLKGDMALVGPRPELVEMGLHYRGPRRLKFKVKPGVTGMAQINGRGDLNFAQTVALDVEYVRNRSLLLDFKLLAKTVVEAARGSGAF
jgi:lipopolysaccharide/colanic/teichoic acid biosynthesis glycosyltransferase